MIEYINQLSDSLISICRPKSSSGDHIHAFRDESMSMHRYNIVELLTYCIDQSNTDTQCEVREQSAYSEVA
jgi:hypothetical protein